MDSSLRILAVLLCVLVYESSAITLVSQQSWKNCQLANSTVFCENQECDANRLSASPGFTVASNFIGPARVDASLQWVKMAINKGCSVYSENYITSKHTILNNNVEECLKKCDARFALRTTTCICLRRNMVGADSESLCDAKCPGSDETCGSTDEQYVSYYHQLSTTRRVESGSTIPMEKMCGIYIEEKIDFRPCNDKHPFYCYSAKDKSSKEGTAFLTWTEASKWCKARGLLLANGGQFPSDMHRTQGCWIATTKMYNVVWDKGQDENARLCVAVRKNNNVFNFEAQYCDSSTPGLCMGGITTKAPVITAFPTTPEVTSTAPTTQSPKVPTTTTSTTVAPSTTTTKTPVPIKVSPSTSEGKPTVKTTAKTTPPPTVASKTSDVTKAPNIKISTEKSTEKPDDKPEDKVITGQLSESTKDTSSVVYIVSAVASALVLIAIVVIILLICRKRKANEGKAKDEENQVSPPDESASLLKSAESNPVNGSPSKDSNSEEESPEKNGETIIDSEGYGLLKSNHKRENDTSNDITYDHLNNSTDPADDTYNLLQKEDDKKIAQQEANAEVYDSPREDKYDSLDTGADDKIDISGNYDTVAEIAKENG